MYWTVPLGEQGLAGGKSLEMNFLKVVLGTLCSLFLCFLITLL